MNSSREGCARRATLERRGDTETGRAALTKRKDLTSAIIELGKTLNLELGGVDLTGGVLSLGFGNIDALADVDNKISATAITAGNEFNDGDLLDVELIAGGTGLTAGIDNASFELWADVEYRAGA